MTPEWAAICLCLPASHSGGCRLKSRPINRFMIKKKRVIKVLCKNLHREELGMDGWINKTLHLLIQNLMLVQLKLNANLNSNFSLCHYRALESMHFIISLGRLVKLDAAPSSKEV